jgi:hypothetical protein
MILYQKLFRDSKVNDNTDGSREEVCCRILSCDYSEGTLTANYTKKERERQKYRENERRNKENQRKEQQTGKSTHSLTILARPRGKNKCRSSCKEPVVVQSSPKSADFDEF